MTAKEFLSQPFKYRQHNVKGPLDVALINELCEVLGHEQDRDGWDTRTEAAYMVFQKRIEEYWPKQALADAPPDGRTIIDPPPSPPMSPGNYGAPKQAKAKGGWDDQGTPCE